MAIACQTCGRHYDVSLFEYGRTIHCTCGRLVAFGHHLEIPAGQGPPRFFADAMLERAARWLRILGMDCAFERGINDADLVRRATDEARVILTRDRDFRDAWRVLNVFFVSSGRTASQLEEIVTRFDLSGWFQPFTRCSRCNRVLEEASLSAVADRVPQRVLEARMQVRRCPECERIYWHGTHAERMRAVIRQITK